MIYKIVERQKNQEKHEETTYQIVLVKVKLFL